MNNPLLIKCCVILTCTTLLNLPLRAQDDCAFQLDSARNLFDNGMIEDIPQVLAPCLEEGFTREQKISAYKLIIMSYLFDDNQQGAESTMLNFLDEFPNYEIRPDDAVEFVYLFESYRTLSVFSVGFFMGPNVSAIRTIEPVSPDASSGINENRIGASTQFGLRLNRYLFKQLEANVEIMYSRHQYENFINVTGIAETTYSEILNTWEIPLYVSYDLNTGKLVPFIFAGPSVGFISSAQGTPTSVFTQEDGAVKSGAERDITDRRATINFSVFAGGGLKYKMPKGYFGVDLRFNAGLNNLLPEDAVLNNEEAFGHGYIDNKFALNSIYLTIGYHYTLYQPQKIR